MTLNTSATERDPRLLASIETIPGGRTRVSVHGELDIATAAEFRSLLSSVLHRDGPDVEIDALHLRFCDSRGLAALVAAGNRAEALGGRITIVNARPFVAKVLRVTGLDRRFAPTVVTSHPPDAQQSPMAGPMAAPVVTPPPSVRRWACPPAELDVDRRPGMPDDRLP